MKGLQKKSMKIENVDFFFFFFSLKEYLQLWKILYFYFSIPECFVSLLTVVANFPPDRGGAKLSFAKNSACPNWLVLAVGWKHRHKLTRHPWCGYLVLYLILASQFIELASSIGTLSYTAKGGVLGAFSNPNMQVGTWSISEIFCA